jgi:hypothetical protein
VMYSTNRENGVKSKVLCMGARFCRTRAQKTWLTYLLGFSYAVHLDCVRSAMMVTWLIGGRGRLRCEAASHVLAVFRTTKKIPLERMFIGLFVHEFSIPPQATIVSPRRS